MLTVSSAELDEMRSASEDLMPDTCIIKSLATVSDGEGGYEESWVASGTVTCRVESIRTSEPVEGGKKYPAHSYTLTIPHDAAIKTTDHVSIGAIDYNVIGLDGSSYNVNQVCIIEKL